MLLLKKIIAAANVCRGVSKREDCSPNATRNIVGKRRSKRRKGTEVKDTGAVVASIIAANCAVFNLHLTRGSDVNTSAIVAGFIFGKYRIDCFE